MNTARLATCGWAVLLLATNDVWADEVLAIDIHGFGDVRYNGSPWVLQQISGLGDVRRAPSAPALRL